MKTYKVFFPIIVFIVLVGIIYAHNSYTGGYSGSPGTKTCASSCHGGTSGTITVTGFPSVYVPGETYRIVIAHNGGNKIVNFNATTRIGTSSSVAGAFQNVLNAANYNGTDGGVYASSHLIDSAVVNWTAPSAGSGTVYFYAAAFQNSSANSNGQSSSTKITSNETATGIESSITVPAVFALFQNYPNPFNPSTTIKFSIPSVETLHATSLQKVTLKIYDILGREIATLLDEEKSPGTYEIKFNASNIPSGIYFYKLQAGSFISIRKMIVLK